MTGGFLVRVKWSKGVIVSIVQIEIPCIMMLMGAEAASEAHVRTHHHTMPHALSEIT